MRDPASFHSSVLISLAPGVMMIVLILLFFLLGSHRMQKGMGFVLYWIGLWLSRFPLPWFLVFGLNMCALLVRSAGGSSDCDDGIYRNISPLNTFRHDHYNTFMRRGLPSVCWRKRDLRCATLSLAPAAITHLDRA